MNPKVQTPMRARAKRVTASRSLNVYFLSIVSFEHCKITQSNLVVIG